MLHGSIGASFVTSWQPSGEADTGSYIRFWQLPLFRCLNTKKMDRTRKEGLWQWKTATIEPSQLHHVSSALTERYSSRNNPQLFVINLVCNNMSWTNPWVHDQTNTSGFMLKIPSLLNSNKAFQRETFLEIYHVKLMRDKWSKHTEKLFDYKHYMMAITRIIQISMS